MPVWNALANAIKSIDKNHLMTFHPYGRHTSSQWFHNADWLDFNSSQTGHANCSFDIFENLIVGDYNKLPVKPCINMEPCYEDHPVRGTSVPLPLGSTIQILGKPYIGAFFRSSGTYVWLSSDLAMYVTCL